MVPNNSTCKPRFKITEGKILAEILLLKPNLINASENIFWFFFFFWDFFWDFFEIFFSFFFMPLKPVWQRISCKWTFKVDLSKHSRWNRACLRRTFQSHRDKHVLILFVLSKITSGIVVTIKKTILSTQGVVFKMLMWLAALPISEFHLYQFLPSADNKRVIKHIWDITIREDRLTDWSINLYRQLKFSFKKTFIQGTILPLQDL